MEDKKDLIITSIIGGLLSFFIFLSIGSVIHLIFPTYTMMSALINATQFSFIFTIISVSVCLYKLKNLN